MIPELDKAKLPYLNEICKINKKYRDLENAGIHCKYRDLEDETRFRYCWDKMAEINAAYDSKHPLDPCYLCGSIRRASLIGGRCPNIASCRNAPSVMGG